MSGEAPVLVGDIGGTNARFALAEHGGAVPRLLESRALCNADFASVQHVVEHYLAATGSRPRRAALAVACPVGGDEIRLTNRAWSFNRGELRDALGLDELHVLNDFGAVARSLPVLGPDDRVTLHGDPHAALAGPVSVLGPGTGLGVALLVGCGSAPAGDDGWLAVDTEGGHAGFAAIGDEERALGDWLAARHGRASNERLLSGKGLAEIDAFLRGEPARNPSRLREPADIVAAALEGHDLPARRALARFCSVLGSVAGDCALLHGARSVAIAGGIVPRIIPFLRSSGFRERFLAKGRFATLLEGVAIHVVTHPHPGLLGAATALRAPPRSTP